jgi:hypothetical protein
MGTIFNVVESSVIGMFVVLAIFAYPALGIAFFERYRRVAWGLWAIYAAGFLASVLMCVYIAYSVKYLGAHNETAAAIFFIAPAAVGFFVANVIGLIMMWQRPFFAKIFGNGLIKVAVIWLGPVSLMTILIEALKS